MVIPKFKNILRKKVQFENVENKKKKQNCNIYIIYRQYEIEKDGVFLFLIRRFFYNIRRLN